MRPAISPRLDSLHLAGRERGHAAVEVAAAGGQHLVAEGARLAVDADNVGDGGLMQVGRQVGEGATS